jgi:site-specific DNA recombinase
MLHNPVYVGKISHDETIHEGKHDAIIDLDTWQRARELGDARALATATKEPNDTAYLLSGLLHCQVCSNRYVAVSANGRAKTYRYYTCRTRQIRGNDACAGPRVPAEQLEHAILASFLSTYQDPELFQAGVAAAIEEVATERPMFEAQVAGADKQLRDTTASLDRYLQAFEAGTMSAELCAQRVEELTVRRAELTAHQAELTAQLRKATPAPPDTRLLDSAATDLQDALSTGEPTVVKHFLRQFIDRIDISPDWQAHPTYRVPETPIPDPQADRGFGPPVRTNEPSVEVAGIEPASFVASTGLLRAQCALSLLGPTGHTHKPVRQAQPLFDVPSSPVAVEVSKSPS